MAVNRIQQGHMPTAFCAAACAPPSDISFQSPIKSEKTPRASFLLPKLTLEDCFNWDNILYSQRMAFKGKKHRKRYFLFAIDLGLNLTEIHDSVLGLHYQPNPPRRFVIFCNSGQKFRTIHSSSVRDVVTQRTVYDYLYPAFDRGFVFDNYGCRKGKGTLKAADRVQQFVRASPKDSYYLQLDVRKFYYNIDHAALRELLAKRIKDTALLDLCLTFAKHEPNADSYTPYAPDVGLNVGAMVSQLFGLIYLDYIDHFIKDELRVKRYVRYVDDMVIIGESKDKCLELKAKIEERLHTKLHLKLSYASVQPLRHGINFAGFVTYRERRYLRKFSQRNFNRKLKKWHGKTKSLQAHLAHARHTASFGRMAARIVATCPELIIYLTGSVKYDLLKFTQKNRGPRGHDHRLLLQSPAR